MQTQSKQKNECVSQYGINRKCIRLFVQLHDFVDSHYLMQIVPLENALNNNKVVAIPNTFSVNKCSLWMFLYWRRINKFKFACFTRHSNSTLVCQIEFTLLFIYHKCNYFSLHSIVPTFEARSLLLRAPLTILSCNAITKYSISYTVRLSIWCFYIYYILLDP